MFRQGFAKPDPIQEKSTGRMRMRYANRPSAGISREWLNDFPQSIRSDYEGLSPD